MAVQWALYQRAFGMSFVQMLKSPNLLVTFKDLVMTNKSYEKYENPLK